MQILEDDVHEGLQEFFGMLTTTEDRVVIFQPNATALIQDNDGKMWLHKHYYVILVCKQEHLHNNLSF